MAEVVDYLLLSCGEGDFLQREGGVSGQTRADNPFEVLNEFPRDGRYAVLWLGGHFVPIV